MGGDVVGVLVAIAAALSSHAGVTASEVAGPPLGDRPRLELSRTLAKPGEAVDFIVVNPTDKQVRYGLATTVQRADAQGRWIRAVRAVYGTRRPMVRLILLHAPKHGSGSSPGFDGIELPADIRSGRYRVIKSVDWGSQRDVRIQADFDVVR